MSKKPNLFALILGALFIGGIIMTTLTKGVRNKNPLNIRKGARWVGLATEQNDPDFAVFTDPKYGFRAATRILKTYSKKYGINTITGIITRWAPPAENDTESYINYVERKTGLNRHKVLSPERDYLVLLSAMSKMETGKDYNSRVISDGISLA